MSYDNESFGILDTRILTFRNCVPKLHCNWKFNDVAQHPVQKSSNVSLIGRYYLYIHIYDQEIKYTLIVKIGSENSKKSNKG